MLCLTRCILCLIKPSMDWLAMLKARDIVGKLQGRNISLVTDQIIFYLDWESMKNASLVSKRWREAVLIALCTISRSGNPCWSAEQRNHWLELRSHLTMDFHISAGSCHYIQCLANSMQFVTEQLQVGCWSNPGITLDYLPYSAHDDEDDEYGDILSCCVDMNEKFIVAWDLETRLFKCWLRRTLAPLPIDQDLQIRSFPSVSLPNTEKKFHLSGNNLFYVEISKDQSREGFTKVDISKIDLLDANTNPGPVDRREREEFTSWIYVKSPFVQPEGISVYIDHFKAFDGMILLLLSFEREGTVRNCFIAMWKLERGEARDVLKSALPRLPITCFDSVFSDKDYVVVWRIFGQVPSSLRSEIRTYSLHPPKKYADGKTAEVRSIISFEIATPLAAEYKDGLFVFTSKHLGPIITFVDVLTGSTLKSISIPDALLSTSRNFIKLTRNLMICTEIRLDDPSSDEGTIFHVWDLKSILRQPDEQNPPVVSTICRFKTLTSFVLDVFVDEFGIVAVVEDDSGGDRGIQVLNFLPACSHCKRLTKPSLLAKCNVCNAATYCSEECQTADGPHHGAICTKVEPLSFT